MNISIYNETNQFLYAINLHEDGQISEQEYKDICEYVCEQIQLKSANVIAYVEEEKENINAIKNQEDRLKKLRKEKELKLEKISDAIKDSFSKLNIKKVETNIGSISLCSSPNSVEILELEKIPDEFIRIKTIKEADKIKIKNHFEETGEIIEGARIITDNTSLRFK